MKMSDPSRQYWKATGRMKLILHFRSEPMVERRLAVGVFRLVFTSDDRDIQHPATAGLAIKGRLLCTMPDTAVMYGKVAGKQVETNLAPVRVVVDKVLLTEQQPQYTLFV